MTYPLAPVGALASVALGKMVQPHRRAETDVQMPYLRAAHVQPGGRLDFTVSQQEMWFAPSEQDSLTLIAEDVVVVEGGAGFGRTAVLKESLGGWGFQNSIVRVRPQTATDGRFLSYALRSALEAGAIAVATSTATIPHFTAEKVGRFRVPAPPVDQQRRMADYLDRETAEIDAMDAELDRLIENLRERRGSVVLGQLRAGVARHQGVALQMVASIITGAGFPTDDQGQEGLALPFYKVNALARADADGVIRFQDHTISEATAERLRAGVVPEGSSVMAKIGAALMLGRVRQLGQQGCIDNNMLALVPGPKVHSRYLFWALHSLDMNQVVNPSTIPFLNERTLRQFQVSLPPIEEQRRIVRELDEQTARIGEMIADAQRLKALLAERRSTLITEVVTGKKEVPA